MATEPHETAPRSTEQADAGPRVRTMACLGGVCLERNVPTEEVRGYLRDAANLVWMDVQDPGPAELSMLLEEFGFHPLALEDVAKAQQRPKVDEYKGYLFAVTYGVVPSDDAELHSVEVNLFIGRNYLVTVHRGRLPALDEATARWTRGGPMLREGIGFLVYTVLDALVDAYFPLLDAIEQQVDELEVQVFIGFQREGMQRLLRLKRTLVALRRVLYPLREVFHVFLRPEHPFFSANTRVYMHDVYDHVLRLLDVLDLQREMVAGTTEAYLTVSSNRLNETMKKLTVATVCVAILGAVFGAWGMNFAWLPLTEPWWGFWAVIGGTVGLVVAVLVWGKSRDWF